jgi:hypothetical protein
VFSTAEKTFSWHISDSGTRFKIVLPFSAVTLLEFSAVTLLEFSVAAIPTKSEERDGLLSIHLNQSPSFFIEVSTQGRAMWSQCDDFTEQKQASTTPVHILRGRPDILRSQIQSLIQTETTLQKVARIDETHALLPPGLQQLKLNPNHPVMQGRRGSMPVFSPTSQQAPFNQLMPDTQLSLTAVNSAATSCTSSPNMEQQGDLSVLDSSSIHSFLHMTNPQHQSFSNPTFDQNSMVTASSLTSKHVPLPLQTNATTGGFDRDFVNLIQVEHIDDATLLAQATQITQF